jgi:hypothetical protein
MLTMVAVIGLIVVVGGVGIVLGLAPDDRLEADVAVAPPPEPARASAFFVVPEKTEVHIEVLLARLEQHVRQERAAVETFHDEPSAASLRSRTSSPLAN